MMQPQGDDFHTWARSLIDVMSEKWASGLDSRDKGAIADVHHDLSLLRDTSRKLALDPVVHLCDKLEELTVIAQRRQYDVPEELFLTASMGLEFLGFLIGNPEGADLDGFIGQIDEVLRDVRLLPGPTSASPSRSPSTAAAASALPFDDVDYLSRATRIRLGRVATSLYLDAQRATGPFALRLRESWLALRRELSTLARVSLRGRLLPLLRDIAHSASAQTSRANIVVDVEDALVSPELARALETAVGHLVERTLVNGIDSPAVRAELGKPLEPVVRVDSRIRDGRVTLCVEDDGAGIDLADLTHTPAHDHDAPLDEHQAHRLLVDRCFSPEGVPDSAVNIGQVRDALTRDDATIRVRNIVRRGTAVTISVPDGSTVNVRTFRSPAADVLFAVDASWSVSETDQVAVPIHPIEALGLRAHGGPTRFRRVVFTRGHLSFEMTVRSMPALAVATRLFSPDTESSAEVVLVGEAEALFLRLDVLANSGSQTTVPPPMTLVPRG